MSGRLGRYVLLKHLASGGMADVLLARADGIEGFERHVVIKRIRPELARDARFIRMFLDEARVGATLHHQNIVQVYDIGEIDGEYFIAMEYVHGEDTRKLLANAAKRTHVPLCYVVSIVSAAAAALHHAHEQRGSDRRPLNIVHRDVSPSNILIGYDGAVKLLDFGIATASTLQETRSGSLKGKLSYMSPEQCRGTPVDRRADIYALGVVLYELATTTRMIKGENDYQVMEQVVHGRITPPQSRRPELPEELTNIIMRALATEREARYATADELRTALENFAQSAGLTASSAALSSYMHKQFGDVPEPWHDLSNQPEVRLEDMPSRVFDSGSGNVWSEQPISDRRKPTISDLRHSSDGFHISDARRTGPIPEHSGRLLVEGATVSSAAARYTPLPSLDTLAAPVNGAAAQGGTAEPSRGVSRGRVAVIAGVPLSAVLVWLVVSSGKSELPPVVAQPAPTPAAASQAPPSVTTAPAPAASAPAPSPTVAPEPTRAAATVEPTSVEPAPRTVRNEKTRTSEPRRRVAASVPIRETPSGGKEPARVAQASPEPPASVEPADHRPAAVPVPPPAVPAPAPAAPPVVAPAVTAAPSLVTSSPAPAPVVMAKVVTPVAMDANRISGNRDISPDGATLLEIKRANKNKVTASFKLCVNSDGAVSTIAPLQSTGFASFDAKIENTIRDKWRYRPFVIDGHRTPVCTKLGFVYWPPVL